MTRYSPIALALLASCGYAADQTATGERVGQARQPLTHVITIQADGTFTPLGINIQSGDTVEWRLHSDEDAIVPIDWTGAWDPVACDNYKAYDATDPNEFTGPMPHAPSGVFSLSPATDDDALAPRPAGSCPDETSVTASRDDLDLCRGAGTPFTSMSSTFESDQITGVFIRLPWKLIHTGVGTFDFTVLDDQIDEAVANGKLYSLGFGAGKHGTPDWIFTAGVTELRFEDGGSHLEVGRCGSTMRLGSPSDHTYREHYNDMLEAVANHLKERNDRYRALAYIKPSGANLLTHENRLPKRCKTDEGCRCNTKTWSNAGYRPSALYGFYGQQFDVLASAFDGKAMSYALIQAGFPQVADSGAYALFDGSASDGVSILPTGTEQTVGVLNLGQLLHPADFVVTHNGLGPAPPAETCPNHDLHPVPLHPLGWYGASVTACPNKWALREGAQGQITGFQTNNANAVFDGVTLDATFDNLWDNSDGVYLEIYEQRLWEADDDVLDADDAVPRTLADWDARLDTRRPKPLTHSHTFTYTGDGDYQYLWYAHGNKCNAPGGSSKAYGVVAIIPPGD